VVKSNGGEIAGGAVQLYGLFTDTHAVREGRVILDDSQAVAELRE
jgi:hypothetical protein